MASSLPFVSTIPSTFIARRRRGAHSISAFLPSFSPVSSVRQTLRPPSNSRRALPVSTLLADQEAPANLSAPPPPSLPFRVGHGFDLHRLEPGYSLIIGGVTIPHDRGCEAHSDGDVLLHCVVDAILGALGLPDIGQIFPDNDPKWKGAASSLFIKEAVPHLLWP